MDINKLSRVQDSTDSVFSNLKDEMSLVNSGDMNFIDFLSSNEKQLLQLSHDQINSLAAIAEDKEIKSLLGKAAQTVKDDSTTVSSIGTLVPSVYGKVVDGNPFIEYIYRMPDTDDFSVDINDDYDKVYVRTKEGKAEFDYDQRMSELSAVSNTTSIQFPEVLDEEQFLDLIDTPAKVSDAQKVTLTGDKLYSMYELKNKPPKWVEDLELWDHIVETVTENGTKEVKIVVPLSIYKKKLAKKREAMKVDDSALSDVVKMFGAKQLSKDGKEIFKFEDKESFEAACSEFDQWYDLLGLKDVHTDPESMTIEAVKEVSDSFRTHDYSKYLQDVGYNVSPVKAKKVKEGYEIKDVKGKTIKVKDRGHALEVIADQLYDALVDMDPKPYAHASKEEINQWAERYAMYMVQSFVFV